MKISKRQLRRIIREAMVTAGTPFSSTPNADWMDSAEYDRGYQDGMDRSPVADNGTPDYDAGYEDGILDAELAKWRPGDR